MRSASRWGMLALALTLAGCTAGGAGFSPLAAGPGKAVIYVYTLEDDMMTQSPQIVIDGREVGTLKRLGHLAFEVEPGHHAVATTAVVLFKQKPVEIDVAAGQNLYLRFDSFRGSMLTQMPPDIAGDEIKSTRAS
jgi:hypothetical protein